MLSLIDETLTASHSPFLTSEMSTCGDKGTHNFTKHGSRPQRRKR